MPSFFKKLNHSKSSKIDNQLPPSASLPTPPSTQIRDSNSRKSTISPRSVLDAVDNSILDRSRSSRNENDGVVDPDIDSHISPMLKQFHRTSSSSNSGVKSFSSPKFNDINHLQQGEVPNTPEYPPFSDNVLLKNSPHNNEWITPWSKKVLYNSPFPRYGYTISSQTSTSGSSYMMGGLTGTEVYGDMWIIEQIRPADLNQHDDPLKYCDYPYIASPIENIQHIPSPRTGHASVLIGNAFIIFGGDTAINEEQKLDNQLYFFNIASLKWTITAPKGERPCGRYGAQISVLNLEIQPGSWLSQLYVFGGQLNNVNFNDLWKFDLTNFKNPENQWIKIDPMGDTPPPLTGHSMSSFNENLYVFGGNSDAFVNDKLYSYNSIKNEWNICTLAGPIFPPPIYGHSTAVHGSLLFIYGGKLENEENSNDLYIIDLLNFNSWKLKSNLPLSPTSKFGQSISLNLTEEKLLIMGGDVTDDEFNGVADTSINLIDETKFQHSTSIIYECDIKEISKFLENSNIKKGIMSARSSPVVFPTFNFKNTKYEHSKSNIDLTDSNDESRKSFTSSTPIKIQNQSIVSEPKNEPLEITTDTALHNIDQVALSSSNPSPISEISPTIKDTSNLQPILQLQTVDNESQESETPLETSTDFIANEIIYKTPEENIESVSKSQHLSDSTFTVINTKTSIDETLKAPSISTPLMQQSALLPFSPAVSEKDNLKLQKLLKMVNDVKSEMKTSVAAADAQISRLESEKADLEKRLKGLQETQTVVYNINDIEGGGDTSVDERNMKLKNFISHELSTVPQLQKLVNIQRETINDLRNKLQEEELLNEKILKLEAINSALKMKLNNATVGESRETEHLKLFNQNLEQLSAVWLAEGPQTSLSDLKSELSDLKLKYNKLQKENEGLFGNLREYETLFVESKKSLSNSYQALKISQTEADKLKAQVINLTKELDELKLKKRVYSNGSQRNFTPVRNDSNHSIEATSNDIEDEIDDHNVSLIDERYEIKIRDLEANVYIVSQERDQLRNELLELKKELYNIQK